MTSNAPAGWYPDGTGGERWFDGERWTEVTRPPSSGPGMPGDPARQDASTALAAAAVPAVQVEPYRAATTLVRWLKALLVADLVLAAISVVSDIAGLILIDGFLTGTVGYTDELATANDTRQQLIGIAVLVLLVATAVVFLVWIHRANRNARAFGAQGMSFTPGWSVGWWFVPFASLIMPFRVLREIWLASDRPLDWQAAKPKTPALLGWYWALWLISSILGTIAARVWQSATTADGIIAASVTGIFADATNIAASALALGVVTKIVGIQAARAGAR